MVITKKGHELTIKVLNTKGEILKENAIVAVPCFSIEFGKMNVN